MGKSGKDSKVCNVLINVGIVKENEDKGGLQTVRGSKLPIKVNTNDSYESVLGAAVKKHSAHDQYFCALDDYVLLYLDHKIAKQIPGSNETFTVEGYKKELAKAYSKVSLFICSQNILHQLKLKKHHTRRNPFINLI